MIVNAKSDGCLIELVYNKWNTCHRGGVNILEEIVRLCDERYRSHGCRTCSYGIHCPNSCEKCLEYIHYPHRAPAVRRYDCERMADFYVCKYAYKYTSELVYAFLKLRDLKKKTHLKVLSIGCGPCTDLLALNYLRKNGEYRFDTIDYCGIEFNTGVWNNIYNDIRSILPWNWSFDILEEDICDYIDQLLLQNYRPDLIVLQYVLSDMHKHTRAHRMSSMISSLADYIDTCNCGTYVVCNDINLTISQDGGREYFDQLHNKLQSQNNVRRNHFKNSNRPNHFDYGEEYNDNSLVIRPYPELSQYYPYISCSSAQMIIKRE